MQKLSNDPEQAKKELLEFYDSLKELDFSDTGNVIFRAALRDGFMKYGVRADIARAASLAVRVNITESDEEFLKELADKVAATFTRYSRSLIDHGFPEETTLIALMREEVIDCI